MVKEINELDFSPRFSYADYLTWQFKERVELLKGLVHKMSPALMDQHQRIASAL